MYESNLDVVTYTPLFARSNLQAVFDKEKCENILTGLGYFPSFLTYLSAGTPFTKMV